MFGDRYVLRELIGEGGMGRVFRAEETSLGRSVAVKFLRASLASDHLMLQRFRVEVQAASLLSHPNVVAVVDFGVADPGGPYLVMEYVRGPSLTRILTGGGPLPLRRVVRLVEQILSALDHAHRAGVVHADIKSDNILVETAEGGQEKVKIIDFGLARLRSSVDGVGDDGLLSGTPDYLAPEVIRGGTPDASADLYAVGIILFELLTGTTPFGGGTAVQILNRHLRDAVVPPSLRRPDRLILPAFEKVVVRALSKDPAARFADAASFRAALSRATRELDLDAIGQPAARVAGDARSTTDSTTFNWGPGTEPVAAGKRFALGSRPAVKRVARTIDRGRRVLYQAIADAMARGATEEIADGYLELARALVRSGEVLTAIGELKEAIDVVSLGCGLKAIRPAPAVSRLLAGLAGLHGLAGDRGAARQAAIQSHKLAQRPR